MANQNSRDYNITDEFCLEQTSQLSHIQMPTLPQEHTANDFVEIVASWVGEGATLVVDSFQLSVDACCPRWHCWSACASDPSHCLHSSSCEVSEEEIKFR